MLEEADGGAHQGNRPGIGCVHACRHESGSPTVLGKEAGRRQSGRSRSGNKAFKIAHDWKLDIRSW
jgi:hypothetical protein